MMRSIIERYSHELKDPKTNQPSGKFVVERDNAFAIAREVVQTHLKLSGDALESYINGNVPEAFDKWDVNKEGHIEAERVPTFLRSIVGNVEAGFGLQAEVNKQSYGQKH